MEKYKTLGRRFGAIVLDSFILMPITGVASFIFFFIDLTPNKVISSMIPGFISVFYYILMHAYNGQTFGKMAAKVKVLNDSETPINFGQAVLRSLPQLFPVMFAFSSLTANQSDESSIKFWASIIYGLVSLFFILDVIVCLTNEKHRALHDFIAGTIVIKTDV